MEARAPESDRSEAEPNRWATTGLVAVVAAVAVLALTWWATRVGDKVLATIVAVVSTGLGASAVAVVGRRLRLSEAQRTALVASTLVLGFAVAALSWSGTLAAAKAQRNEPGWQAAADRVLTRGAERGASAMDPDARVPCTFGPQIDEQLRELEGFGRVDQICSSSTPGFRSVSFSQKDDIDWTGLVYSPDSGEPLVMSTCVAHLDGPWWQTASANPNCPPGFVFIGGG